MRWQERPEMLRSPSKSQTSCRIFSFKGLNVDPIFMKTYHGYSWWRLILQSVHHSPWRVLSGCGCEYVVFPTSGHTETNFHIPVLREDRNPDLGTAWGKPSCLSVHFWTKCAELSALVREVPFPFLGGRHGQSLLSPRSSQENLNRSFFFLYRQTSRKKLKGHLSLLFCYKLRFT